jgi:hypothetical protein
MFLGNMLFKNYRSIEEDMTSSSARCWKGCKILNMSCLESEIGLLYSIVCQNFHLSYQLHSYCV